jgi:hypothetical protein
MINKTWNLKRTLIASGTPRVTVKLELTLEGSCTAGFESFFFDGQTLEASCTGTESSLFGGCQIIYYNRRFTMFVPKKLMLVPKKSKRTYQTILYTCSNTPDHKDIAQRERERPTHTHVCRTHTHTHTHDAHTNTPYKHTSTISTSR